MIAPDIHPQPGIVWTEVRDAVSNLPSPIDTSISYEFIQRWETQLFHLSELRKLQKGWDGEDALPPAGKTIDRAKEILLRYRDLHFLAPTGIVSTEDGTIFIQWQIPDFFASLEINSPYRGDWLIERKGLPTEFKTEEWIRRDYRQMGDLTGGTSSTMAIAL